VGIGGERTISPSAILLTKEAPATVGVTKLTRWVIYGAPANELKQAIADFHPIYMTPFDGFIR
jgi:hypothetical protein